VPISDHQQTAKGFGGTAEIQQEIIARSLGL
jgi:hypothetical protein